MYIDESNDVIAADDFCATGNNIGRVMQSAGTRFFAYRSRFTNRDQELAGDGRDITGFLFSRVLESTREYLERDSRSREIPARL